MRLVLIVLLSMGLVSCASTSRKTGPLKYSIVAIKTAAVKHIPSTLETTSPNGREMYFEYFQMPSRFSKRKGMTKNGKALERAKAKVVLLGERRPYTLEIEIRVESLEYGGYKFVRHSIPYSEFLVKRIQKTLVKRHEKSNVIDDFRAF